MPNYEQFKQAWNSMWNAERRKYTEQYKNDSQFQQFANQYSQEMKNQDSSWVNNQNNASNMNGWTNTQQDTTTTQNQTNANGSNWHYDPIYYRENNSENNNTENNQNVKVAEDFDSSRLTNPNAEVSVKEWTAAQTWLPDYQADSDARDNEIVNNLNSYYNTNKSFFTDRDTFNKTFHYSERNDRQKALLDSFWKGKEDKDKAAGYTTGSSITQGFDSAQITPDIMNYIREYNPEAYAEWQKAMQDEVNKRIANFAVPRTATQTADIWQDLVKQLWLEQWDPYQIYDNWYGMCESLGVFAKNRQLDQYIAEMEQVKSERTAAIQRTMSQWAWRKSQALINAEVAKTSALYDTRFADLQNQYNAVYNQRQQNLAIANQSAQALQMQGAEDSRVFNNKLNALWFAMKVDDYRTPEQQAQLWLQTAAIQADLNLLNQSKSNDLALYNKYATAQLENRLSSELSDLNVKDENQLRSNLNNILSQYYSKYWDIIKRSQPQVVDDILKYAKENWISVAEALTKNFIEPLQSKPEYQNKINQDYWMYGSQSLWKIWTDDVIITKNPDWTMSFKYLGNTQANNLSQGLANFVLEHPVNSKWGQCWSFVNDYLEDLWLGRLFWNEYSQKQSIKNTDVATVWSVAIMPSSTSPKNWHVAIVTSINNEKWTVTVVESNWWKDEKVHTREVKMSDIYWYYAPSIDWWWTTYTTGYNSSRVPAYERYLKDWTYPTDAKLKSLWNWDLQKWMQIFESEVENYANEKWTEYYSPEAKKEIVNLRKEFNNLQEVKDARDVMTSFNKILASSNWTAAWDMSMIFAYMKMLDPSSVVREWEFASAQNTAWIPERILNYYNNARNWTRLSTSQRSDFINIAQQFLTSYVERYNQLLNQYKSYAVEWWNVDDIWEYMKLPWNYSTTSLQELAKWGSSNNSTINDLVNRWKNL